MRQLNCIIKSNCKAIEAKTFVAGNELKIDGKKFCLLAVNTADTSVHTLSIFYIYYIYYICRIFVILIARIAHVCLQPKPRRRKSSPAPRTLQMATMLTQRPVAVSIR